MEKYDIVLYKSRNVWSNPCLPLYLRNAIVKSSLKNEIYEIKLIFRRRFDEKWKCRKKDDNNNDNTFVILDVKNDGLLIKRRHDKRKRQLEKEDDLDSLFDDDCCCFCI